MTLGSLGGAPTRLDYQDKREIASQPWYKMPTKLFAYDPADAVASTQRIVDLFHASVGAAR